MKVDTGIRDSLVNAGTDAARLEAAGYDGAWSAETSHDPFLPLALAAEHTERIDLGTSIVVAFARNPMTVAATAHDLQTMSKGRFFLGLGSQIKPHIEKRFSMPWSHPAARMREFVLAMRAIWDCWENDTPLQFRGEFYRHTLMTPFFNPGPTGYGPPKVLIAGVGERMTEVAGEVCDGFLCHSFTTERYLREATIPAIERGMAAGGRSRAGFQIKLSSFVVTGTSEAEFDAAKRATRDQVAFYGSTPAYRPVLEAHGWGELQTELNRLSKRGMWREMGDAIDDEVLSAFAVVGEPDEIAPQLLRRYGDVVDRLAFYTPGQQSAAEHWHRIAQALRAG